MIGLITLISNDEFCEIQKPNLNQAEIFLKTLDPKADEFTFQTFNDCKHKPDRSLSRIITGKPRLILPELKALNRRGAGIFVTVNETDGKGRSLKNIVRPRAVWGEFDDGPPLICPLEPSIVVESSPDKYHYYWLVNDLTHETHQNTMDHLVKEYASDPNAKDLSRVLRVPGFLHQKSTPQLSRLIETTSYVYSSSQIKNAFPPLPKIVLQTSRPQKKTNNIVDQSKLFNALETIPAMDRETWLTIGMALHHEYSGTIDGFIIWDIWSQKCPEKYNTSDQKRTWDSFRPHQNGKTAASIFHLATTFGWGTLKNNPANISHSSIKANTQQTMDMTMKDELIVIGPKLRASVRQDYIIEDLIWKKDLSALVGGSGSGKSFLAIDMATHIAIGKKWQGKDVKKCGVLYIVLEGHRGATNRFLAQVEKHISEFENGQQPPFAYTNLEINLCNASDTSRILKLIHEFKVQFEEKAQLIIIDTVAQSLGGDENAFEVMQSYLKNCKLIAREVSTHVMVIHHHGKDVSRGPRGHSCFFAACDTIIEIKRDGSVSSVEVSKQKDADANFETEFELEQVGLDTYMANGKENPITTCVPIFKNNKKRSGQ